MLQLITLVSLFTKFSEFMKRLFFQSQHSGNRSADMGFGEESGRKKAIVILSVLVPLFGITYSLVAIIRNNFAATGITSVLG